MMSPFGSEGSTHDIRTLVAPVGTIRGAWTPRGTEEVR